MQAPKKQNGKVYRVSVSHKNLNRVFVFNSTLESLLPEAWLFLRNADLISQNKTLECFGLIILYIFMIFFWKII